MNIPAEIVYGLGALALLAALAYGFWRNKTRNRANDRITEKATRDVYDKPLGEYQREREDLKRKVRPS